MTDMRGINVTIPNDPQRVAIADRGFIAQVLVTLGVQDKVVSAGGLVNMNPTSHLARDTLVLNPDYVNMPNFGYPGYVAFNIETLAASNPDIVIWKQTDRASQHSDTAVMMQAITDVLQIPLIVIYEPGYQGTSPDIETNYDAISLLGEVFNKQSRANQVVEYLQSKISEITNITENISAEDKQSVLVMGLAQGGTAYVYGTDYMGAMFIEEIAGVINAYGTSTISLMSTEQILVFNPDMIVLVDGPVNPNVATVYSNSNYSEWSVMDAVANNRVCSVGQMIWWGESMLNFPSIQLIIAKNAYPDLFTHVNLTNWIKDYEMNLYDVDSAKADQMMYAQKLYWGGIIDGP